MVPPRIRHHTWTPHLKHTSNGISPQHCQKEIIPSRWMVYLERLLITLRSPWARILRYQERRLTKTPPSIILVDGHEIQINSSREVSQRVFLFKIVRIEAQHQEIQSLFCFLVSLFLSSMIFSMPNFHCIRHVCSSIRNIRMGKPRYPRCNVYNRWRNPHCWILPYHHQLTKLCQRLAGKFKLPICFVGQSACWWPYTRYQRYSMPESHIYLRLHHIHSFIFQSRLHAHFCLYGSNLKLSFSPKIRRLEADTSGGNCWWCYWRIFSTCFHASSSLVAPKKEIQGKSSLTLRSVK